MTPFKALFKIMENNEEKLVLRFKRTVIQELKIELLSRYALGLTVYSF